MFLKKLLPVILIIGAISLFIYFLFFKPVYVRSEYSPDKVYKLEIYRIPRLFTMPGDGGSDCAYFKLYKGKRRIKDDLEDCEAFVNMLEIEWDYSNCIVWFARGHGIYLDKEDCSN